MSANSVALIDRDLGARLERASVLQQRAAALAAARFALAQTAVADPILSDGLDALAAGATVDSALVERIEAVVDALDQAQWQLQEKREAGKATEAEHRAAFQKARAANAVLAALNADTLAAASDSIYEAYHATNDLAGLRGVVLSTVSSGA